VQLSFLRNNHLHILLKILAIFITNLICNNKTQFNGFSYFLRLFRSSTYRESTELNKQRYKSMVPKVGGTSPPGGGGEL